jgi:tRNA U34 5-carboxymethylaminomethyl modifying GTPase MnmE/TrmE
MHMASDSCDGDSSSGEGSGSDADSDWSDEGLDPQAAAFLAELRRDAKLMAEGEDDLQQGLDQQMEGWGQGVPAEQQRLLQVAVVGAPNAGKSTLVNVLVGAKVSGSMSVRVTAS